MPQLRELKHREDLEAFQPRDDVSTGTIAFSDSGLESKRQAAKQTRKEEKARAREETERSYAEERRKGKKHGKRRMTDADEFDADSRMLKKLRRGRISKGELDEVML